MSEERKRVVAYIKAQRLKEPIHEAEEHVNHVLTALADDIEAAKHVLHARGEL